MGKYQTDNNSVEDDYRNTIICSIRIDHPEPQVTMRISMSESAINPITQLLSQAHNFV